MKTTKRNYYDPRFKVKVLDAARESGVSAAARAHGIEPNLIYTWKPNEAEIRKAARKADKHDAQERAARPELPLAVSEKPAGGGVEASESGESAPRIVVHGIESWMRGVLKEQLEKLLPALLDEAIRRNATLELREQARFVIARVLQEGIERRAEKLETVNGASPAVSKNGVAS